MWVEDPKTKEKSVSLTLLVWAAMLVIVAGSLEMFEVIKSTSVFPELLYTAAGLYFGRRFDLKGMAAK